MQVGANLVGQLLQFSLFREEVVTLSLEGGRLRFYGAEGVG